MKKIYTVVVIIMILLNNNGAFSQNNTQKGAAQGAGAGAFLGAIAGAAFGEGDFLDDALTGVAVGAGIGALAGALEGGVVDRAQQKQLDELIRAFGEENLKGYIELMKCNHQKAIALFKVGQIEELEDHQLAGYWLEAVAERDRRDTEKTKEMIDELVRRDPDIDDDQMARTAVDQYVLELRGDRRANQLKCD